MTTAIYYNVYSEDGEEVASFLVGSDECGDEITAERTAQRESDRRSKKFDTAYHVERIEEPFE
jgi:hypothetical protein